tara:strand:+ start:71 stop:346 length:276 start_codon:yes stop_codon:yes gene_type:complete
MHELDSFIPFAVLVIIGSISMLVTVNLLSKEVSRERLNQVEDLSKLWKNSFPPTEVLTNKGQKIQKIYRIWAVLVIVVCGIWLLNSGIIKL